MSFTSADDGVDNRPRASHRMRDDGVDGDAIDVALDRPEQVGLCRKGRDRPKGEIRREKGISCHPGHTWAPTKFQQGGKNFSFREGD